MSEDTTTEWRSAAHSAALIRPTVSIGVHGLCGRHVIDVSDGTQLPLLTPVRSAARGRGLRLVLHVVRCALCVARCATYGVSAMDVAGSAEARGRGLRLNRVDGRGTRQHAPLQTHPGNLSLIAL